MNLWKNCASLNCRRAALPASDFCEACQIEREQWASAHDRADDPHLPYAGCLVVLATLLLWFALVCAVSHLSHKADRQQSERQQIFRTLTAAHGKAVTAREKEVLIYGSE